MKRGRVITRSWLSRRRADRTVASLAVIAMTLSGCGGGGGGSDGGGVTAVPPLTSGTPPPTPAPSPLPPAPFGLTADQSFATIGWVQRSEQEVVPATPDELTFAWSESAKTYLATLPGYQPARLIYTFPGNNPVAFSLVDKDGVQLTRGMALHTLGNFSGIVDWFARSGSSYPAGKFAFGIPTLPGNIPAGRRTYDTPAQFESGGGQLTFDAEARTLTGFIEVAWADAWGPYAPTRYPLTPSSPAAGSTSFAAKFDVPGAPTDGLVEGYFTGPQAAELILRWRAPIRSPYDDTWQVMYGVRYGRRQ